MFLSLSSISNGGYVASVATRTVCPPRSGTCEAGLAGAAGCWAWGRWQPTAMSATTTSMVATSHLRLTIPIHLPGSLWEHRECFSSGQGTPLPSLGGAPRGMPRALPEIAQAPPRDSRGGMILNHRMRRLAIPIAVLAVGLLLAPTSSVGAPMSSWDAKACGRIGGTLVFAQAQEAVTLDPHDAVDGVSVNNTSNVFDTLVRFKVDSTAVEPSLAESWTVSPDGLVWTFKLRSGARFHDGTPFNAEAVKFNYDRQVDPKNPYHTGSFDYAEFTFQNVKSVEAVDPLTVRFILSARFAPFLINMAMFSTGIASPTAIRKYGPDFFKNPVGTGPFKFVEWVAKDHVTYEANKDYWAGRPCIDRLIIRGIPDNTVRLLEMERGSVQMMDQVNPPDYDRIRSNKDLVLYSGPGLNVGYLAMNTQNPPFNDRRVRQAVSYAVNKAALVQAFYGGIAQPAKNPMPPPILGYKHSGPEYRDPRRQNKQPLAQAGLPHRTDTELCWPKPARPDLTQPPTIPERLH